MRNTSSRPVLSRSLNEQRFGIGALVFAVFTGALVLAFGLGYAVADRNNPTNATGELHTLWEAWRIAENNFYYPVPNEADRKNAAIQGLISSFKDPYTLYLPPVQAGQALQALRGESGGIGVTVASDSAGRIVIMEVRIGSAAELAGVRPQDVILTVDDLIATSQNQNDVLSKVRGELGSQVTITVERKGEPAPLSFTMTRAQINVYGRILNADNSNGDGSPDANSSGKIAYLSMAIFSSDAPVLLRAELEKLLAQNPRGLILDLRGNPGGYLSEAVNVADLFLPEGIVVTEKGIGDARTSFDSKTGDPGEALPMAVLVDKGSASASEIVAGALQDRKRAVLVGATTYGKGSVQGLYTLSDGSQVRVTNAAWYTPNETPLQGVGLTPDFPVDSTGATSDVVLEAAIKAILPDSSVPTLRGQ